MRKYSFIILLMLAAGIIFTYPGRSLPEEEEVIENQEESSSIAEKADLIQVDNLEVNSFISSPLNITGQARGTWFFEASFPVLLTDWDGLIIAESYATAQGDWMKEEFVPFTATLEFEKPPYGDTGTLILQKDNPSDLPELDDALEIPIQFEN